MRHIFIIIFLLLAAISFGQVDSLPHGNPSPKSNTRAEYAYPQADSAFINAIRDTLWQPRFKGSEVLWYHAGVDTAEWTYIGATIGPKWVKSGTGSGSEPILPAGIFTTSNTDVGFDPGSNLTPSQIIEKVWYGLKPPIATLSGGTTLELTNASTVSQTLIWSAQRQSNTATLSTIIVGGISQSFSQPAQGGSVNGTQSVNTPANTTTVYSNIVTASDGQVATATTTFNYLGKKYYGLLADTTGITTGILNSNIIGLTGVFASTKSLAVNTGTPSGTEFWVYAYPSILGDLSALLFNSIPALEAMNKITLSITNASGYTQNYTVYYNRQGQTQPSDITAQ